MKSMFVPLFLCFIISLFSCVSNNTETKPPTKSTSSEPFKDTLKFDLTEWILNLKKESQKHRDNGEPQKALTPLNTCIDSLCRPVKTIEEYKQLGWAHVNRAYIHEQLLGNYLQAKNDYLAALNLFHKANHQDFYVAAYVIQPLGNIHTRFGENEQALIMLTKFQTISKENNEIEALTNSYNDISRVYLNKKNYSKAIETLIKGLEIKSQNKINTGLLHSSLAEAYLLNNQLNLGLSQALLSESMFLSALNSIDKSDYQYKLIQKYLQEIKKTQGNLLSQKGDYASALSCFKESLKNGREIFPKKHRELGKIHLDVAKFHINSGNINEGVKSYQKLLISMIPNFDSYSIYDNPNVEDLYADVTIGEGLSEKAKTLALLYQTTGEINNLKTSLKTFQKYFEWEKTIRSEQQNDYSRLQFAATNHDIGEAALKVACQLNKLEPNKGWAEIGFRIIDITKSIVLEDTRKRNLNQSLLNANDSAFYQLKQLKVQLSLLSIQLNDSKLAQETAEITRISSQMEKLDEKYQLLHFNIKQKYPTLKSFETDLEEEINLKDLKLNIQQSNSSILNYFESDSSLFLSVLDQEKVSLQELSFSKYPIILKKHIEGVKNPKQVNAISFEQTAHELYHIIFPSNIIKGQNLIVIPDGGLHKLAFETLVSSAKKNKSFKKLEFLIHSFNISYCPSSRFLLNSESSSKELKPYLGIAPIFKNDNDFAWLNQSEKEVHIGKIYMGGDVKINQQATKENLIKNIENYNIVHISTHASKGSNQNNDGWMALTAGDRLQTPEVYQLSLNTNLVILNACETGLGELRKGEGTRSMTTGFLSSGANNVITNLWEANHISNLKLLENFYIKLSSESQPSESLRQSKISFLKSEETSELNAHPYFWAAPVLIGTNEPIIFDESFSYTFIWYLLIPLISLLLFSTMRKIKIRNSSLK